MSELFKPTVDTLGGAPVAFHDMPCAVCLKNHAVLYMNDWIFLPCRQCHAKGWKLVYRPRKWWHFWTPTASGERGNA